MESKQKLIREVIQKLDLNLSEEERNKYTEMMLEIFDKGKSPHEVLGFSDEIIEHMYNYGYRLYNNGNYKSARDVFHGLVYFMPQEPRFVLALAASHHRLKEYDEAAKGYLSYALLEPENPVPLYYMYDCYYQNDYVGDAEACLLEVINRCGENPMYAKIKERSQLMLENLRKEIDQLEKEGRLVLDKEEAEKAGINLDGTEKESLAKKPIEKIEKSDIKLHEAERL